MTIEFDLKQLSEGSTRFLMLKANEWKCTPSEALARILDDRAKRALKVKEAV